MSKSDWTMLIIGLILYQFYTTVLVIKSEDFDDDVKRKQIITIWLIPIVGALLVRLSLNDARRKRMEREARLLEREAKTQEPDARG